MVSAQFCKSYKRGRRLIVMFVYFIAIDDQRLVNLKRVLYDLIAVLISCPNCGRSDWAVIKAL